MILWVIFSDAQTTQNTQAERDAAFVAQVVAKLPGYKADILGQYEGVEIGAIEADLFVISTEQFPGLLADDVDRLNEDVRRLKAVDESLGKLRVI